MNYLENENEELKSLNLIHLIPREKIFSKKKSINIDVKSEKNSIPMSYSQKHGAWFWLYLRVSIVDGTQSFYMTDYPEII